MQDLKSSVQSSNIFYSILRLFWSICFFIATYTRFILWSNLTYADKHVIEGLFPSLFLMIFILPYILLTYRSSRGIEETRGKIYWAIGCDSVAACFYVVCVLISINYLGKEYPYILSWQLLSGLAFMHLIGAILKLRNLRKYS